jgi:hypothetical protein
MTAATAAVGDRERPSTLRTYRDDGPIARALGAAGRAVPLPAELLALLGALAVFAAAAIGGGDSSTGVAGAVVAWLVIAGGLSAGRPETGRLGWAAPPLVRVAEYAALLWLGAVEGGDAVPAAFALLCALAFRHYDLVYRLRHRGVTPPAWVDAASLGWDGRLVLAWILLAVGALPTGFYVLAAIFAAIFVGDSVAGWRGHQRADVGSYEDEDDEGQ